MTPMLTATLAMLGLPVFLLLGSQHAHYLFVGPLPDLPDLLFFLFGSEGGIVPNGFHLGLGIFVDLLDLVLLIRRQIQLLVIEVLRPRCLRPGLGRVLLRLRAAALRRERRAEHRSVKNHSAQHGKK